MTRVKQAADGKGSLRLLQQLINDREDIINDRIRASIDIPSEIKWVSPLKADGYAEYKDQSFLEQLGIKASIIVPLHDFWPTNGPQWDGLGVADDHVLLIEAKANLPELKSSSGASNETSVQLIRNSLKETQDFLSCDNNLDWTKHYYQYANRIAHLYFLRVLNNIPSYLFFIYFIGDRSVNGPTSKEEWQEAIKGMKKNLGLPEHHPLSEYIIELFIHVDEL